MITPLLAGNLQQLWDDRTRPPAISWSNDGWRYVCLNNTNALCGGGHREKVLAEDFAFATRCDELAPDSGIHAHIMPDAPLGSLLSYRKTMNVNRTPSGVGSNKIILWYSDMVVDFTCIQWPTFPDADRFDAGLYDYLEGLVRNTRRGCLRRGCTGGTIKRSMRKHGIPDSHAVGMLKILA